MSNVVALDDHRPMDALCEVRLMRAQNGSLHVAITDAFECLFEATPNMSASERSKWLGEAFNAAVPSLTTLAEALMQDEGNGRP